MEEQMGMLEQILKNTPDPVCVPAGKDYQLQITKATLAASKGNEEEGKPVRPMIVLYTKVMGESTAQMISDYLVFPVEGDTEELAYSFALGLKNMVKSYAIDPATDGEAPLDKFAPKMEPVPIPGWAGKTCWAHLGIQNLDDGRTVNIIKRYILPQPAQTSVAPPTP